MVIRAVFLCWLGACGDGDDDDADTAPTVDCGGMALSAGQIDCAAACARLYQIDGCGLDVGEAAREQDQRCVAHCESAAVIAGDATYEPYQYTPESQPRALANCADAMAWVDCVLSVECDLLGDGYCEPTSFE